MKNCWLCQSLKGYVDGLNLGLSFCFFSKKVKSENEKFAGGLYTTTVETFIPSNGRAIQVFIFLSKYYNCF